MGIMFFLIALELVTLYTVVYLLSAGRAYVGGEGLWSKAEKDATLYLIKYAISHDEKDYQNFVNLSSVIYGDRKARLALQKPQPDVNLAYQGYLEGRNQPADIPRMIRLFYWFQYESHLKKAAFYWVKADVTYFPKLLDLGTRLHEQIVNKTLTDADRDKFISEIFQLNTEITVLEDNFSYSLGDASRWLEHVVLTTVLAIAVTVELSGLLLTLFVTFTIRKGINEITRVANKVKLLDFNERAASYSEDEIGQLAISFNQMTDDLEKNISALTEEIMNRSKQENRLQLRYEITRIMVGNFTFDEAIPKIMQVMCEMLQLQYAGFWKIDDQNNKLRCITTWTVPSKKIIEFAEYSKKTSFSSGSILPGKVWETKQILFIENLIKEPHLHRLEEAKKIGLKSAFAIPILFEGEVRGILEFFTDHLFSMENALMLMLNDIVNMMGIFIQREQAQQRVAALSRLTGRAEVASNVLHSVGNTLNSINTSVTLMTDKAKNSKLSALVELDKLLQQHQDDITDFLINDPKGQSILKFISLLSKEWIVENNYFRDELSSLTKNMLHVKNIIMIQQSLSKVGGDVERIVLPDLLDEAILLNKIAYERAGIQIIRDYSPVKQAVLNKEKIFQICVNIIKNGIDALVEGTNKEKLLIIRLQEKDTLHFMIQFSDNGHGISPENINKIFIHGFTTKKEGHGFGLHTCMLYTKELGGSLSVESKEMMGATFTLILPYQSSLKER